MGFLGRTFYCFSVISCCPDAVSPAAQFSTNLASLSTILKRLNFPTWLFKQLLQNQSHRAMTTPSPLTFPSAFLPSQSGTRVQSHCKAETAQILLPLGEFGRATRSWKLLAVRWLKFPTPVKFGLTFSPVLVLKHFPKLFVGLSFASSLNALHLRIPR